MTSDEALDDLRHRMVSDVAHVLWRVYHGDPDAPYLLWPAKRDASTRVSEQESKILITQWLQSNSWFYSVETPTREKYRQSGASELSARIDVTVYSERNPSARMLNIELKAGTATDKSFSKDFEKLVREGVRGLWFHTLTKARHQTWLSLEDRICRAIDVVIAHTGTATHVLDFAFCVLKSRTLVEFTIDFSTDWRAGLQASIRRATGAVESGTALRPSARMVRQPETENAGVARPTNRVSATVGGAATSGKLKQLVLIPSLEPRTLLHLSTSGESYKLRYFDSTHARTPWKAASCDTLTMLRLLHPATVTVDVASDRRDVTQHSYWEERVQAMNTAHDLTGYE